MGARGRIVAVVAGLAILVLASVIFVTSGPRERVSPVERIFRDALSPALSAVSTVSRSVSGVWNDIAALRGAHAENARLWEELIRLR